jgi:hypothetical protein
MPGANLHPHLHALCPDGVFVERDGLVTFHPLPPPFLGDLNALAWSVCERVLARLRRRGLWLDTDPDNNNDPLAAEQPLLASLAGASLSGTLLFGEKGQRPLRVFASVAGRAAHTNETGDPKSNNGFGFNLDASVPVPTGDRERLERLARYMGRPSIAEDRVQQREDGRYCLWFKRPWSNGTAAVVLSGVELVARLAALVPPPRMHLVRYFGVFAPRARLRNAVVPAAKLATPLLPSTLPSTRSTSSTPSVTDGVPVCRHSGEHPAEYSADNHAAALGHPRSPAPTTVQADAHARRQRMTWAALLERVFAIDVSVCPRCGQKGLQQIAVVTQPEVIRRMRESMERAQGP